MPDYAILKQTLADAGPAADREMAYFYSLLFTAHPELRSMFPLAMDEQRRALSAAHRASDEHVYCDPHDGAGARQHA